jgi:adenylyltransferase/sulfurtransferase
MATEALRLTLGGFGVDGSTAGLAGSLLLVDLLAPSFTAIEVSQDPDCPVCGERPTITALIDYEAFCAVG